MNIEMLTEHRLEATAKWREALEAYKITRKPEYLDLKKIYYQLKKRGTKVVDVFAAIRKAGVHPNQHPKFAIAQAKSKVVFCKYHSDGQVDFKNGNHWNTSKSDVSMNAWLPAYDRIKVTGNMWSDLQLKAPVPIIPPNLVPNRLTDDYYIMWEVDKWEMVPPTDPILLKRVTKTLFVAHGAWDLTPLEQAIMAGRL